MNEPTASARNASLRITEIFTSIQGESSRAGLPTVFVRLTGCPLRCTWCDTEYAFQGGTSRSIDDIVADFETEMEQLQRVTVAVSRALKTTYFEPST